MISVIIAAYNEAVCIAATLDSVYRELESAGPAEVLVVASGCTDGTLEVLAAYRARHRHLRVLVQPKRSGKPAALNQAAGAAAGDVFVLTDADVVWEPGALRALLPPLGMRNVGAVCARVVPANPSEGFASRLAYARCATWHALRQAGGGPSALVIPSGYLYAVQRSVFPRIPDDVIDEDAFVGLKLHAAGLRIEYAATSVVRTAFPTRLKETLRQRVRTETGRLQLGRDHPGEIKELGRLLLAHAAAPDPSSRAWVLLARWIDTLVRVAARTGMLRRSSVVPWAPMPTTKRIYAPEPSPI